MPKLVGINHVALEVDSIDAALENVRRLTDDRPLLNRVA